MSRRAILATCAGALAGAVSAAALTLFCRDYIQRYGACPPDVIHRALRPGDFLVWAYTPGPGEDYSFLGAVVNMAIYATLGGLLGRAVVALRHYKT
jgi:hypothetical protein